MPRRARPARAHSLLLAALIFVLGLVLFDCFNVNKLCKVLHLGFLFVCVGYVAIDFNNLTLLLNVHSAPHLDREKQKCRNFCKFIKKEKLKYHMVVSIQTLCCDTHI